MSEAWQTKVGNFDWLCDFAAIEEFFSPSFTGVLCSRRDAGVGGHEELPRSRALVVGCGTSDLSFQLAHLYDHIVSVDYDPEIIKHMTLAATQLEARDKNALRLGKMNWQVCDILDLDGEACSLYSDSIDIAIDKGTLDAIIVGGSIVNLFVNIHRMLRSDGKYLVISFLSKDLLERLLCIPDFLEVERCTEKIFPSGKVTVVVCRKVVCGGFKYDSFLMKHLKEHEQSITDEYFQESNPWLTEEKKNSITNYFCEFCRSKSLDLDVARLPLPIAHQIVESLDPYLGYTYDLFISDIKNSEMSEHSISYAELLDFLQNLQ